MQKQRDLWAEGIRANKEAKRLALQFVEETFDNLVERAILMQSDFAYEGHFTNEATWDIPRRFKAAGYSIHMIFFGLTNTNLSEIRVVARSKEGGHYVDPTTVAANFYGNLEKLNTHFAIFDSLQIIDTSETEHTILVAFVNGKVESAISSQLLPAWFQRYLPTLTESIKTKESLV